jgi:hypothetical protein
MNCRQIEHKAGLVSLVPPQIWDDSVCPLAVWRAHLVPTSNAEGADRMARLRQRGFRLEYASMTWMTAEAGVAIAAGVIASSIALVGFGLDSVIEFFAAAIVVWQPRGEGEDRETRAVRLIGVTFFALAVYLTVGGIRDLAGQARPQQSIPGLAVTAAALIVMPLLAVAKRRTGNALGNRTLIADSAETAFCALISAATLLGVGLNAWLGWWADPVAAWLSPAWRSRRAWKPGKTTADHGSRLTTQAARRPRPCPCISPAIRESLRVHTICFMSQTVSLSTRVEPEVRDRLAAEAAVRGCRWPRTRGGCCRRLRPGRMRPPRVMARLSLR